MLGNVNENAFADVNTKEFVLLAVVVLIVIGLGIYPDPVYKIISLTTPIL